MREGEERAMISLLSNILNSLILSIPVSLSFYSQTVLCFIFKGTVFVKGMECMSCRPSPCESTYSADAPLPKTLSLNKQTDNQHISASCIRGNLKIMSSASGSTGGNKITEASSQTLTARPGG